MTSFHGYGAASVLNHTFSGEHRRTRDRAGHHLPEATLPLFRSAFVSDLSSPLPQAQELISDMAAAARVRIPATYSQRRSAPVGFGSHRNNLDHANATLVSTVESVGSVVNLTELYLAGSSVWPTRMGGWLCP